MDTESGCLHYTHQFKKLCIKLSLSINSDFGLYFFKWYHLRLVLSLAKFALSKIIFKIDYGI